MIDDDRSGGKPATYLPNGLDTSTHTHQRQFRLYRGRPEKASRFVGVHKAGRRFAACLINRSAGKTRAHIGTFRSERAAAVAYDLAALATYGGEARTNLPRDVYRPFVRGDILRLLRKGFAAEGQHAARAAVALLANWLVERLP